MRDAAAERLGISAEEDEGTGDCAKQFREVAASAVREGSFRVRPNAFVGVEVGRVSREVMQVEARRPRTERANQAASVRPEAIPDHDQVTGDRAQEQAKEVADFNLGDVCGVKLEMKIQPLAHGRNRDSGDHRDPVPPIEVVDRRSLPHRRPRRNDGGSQLKAGFVDEDDVGTQPRGVFFSAGQSSRTKRAICFGSRSSALFCGRWWLQPSA